MLPPNPLQFLLSHPLPKHKHPHPRPDSDLLYTSKTQTPVISATDSCCNIYWRAIQRGKALPATSSGAEHCFYLASNWSYKKKNILVLSMEQHGWHFPCQTGQCLQYMSRLVAACLSADTCHGAVAVQHFSLSFEQNLNLQSWQGQRVKILSSLQFILERTDTKRSSAGFTHLLIWADVRISCDLAENRLTWRDSEVCTKIKSSSESSFHLVIAKFPLQGRNPSANTDHQQGVTHRETPLWRMDTRNFYRCPKQEEKGEDPDSKVWWWPPPHYSKTYITFSVCSQDLGFNQADILPQESKLYFAHW